MKNLKRLLSIFIILKLVCNSIPFENFLIENALAKQAYSYVDEHGVEKSAEDVEELTSSRGLILKPGWYIVNEDITMEDLSIQVDNGYSHDVNIILSDDKTLSINSSDTQSPSLVIGPSETVNKLTIYGQIKGTGKLDILNGVQGGTFVINGGDVSAVNDGVSGAAAINCGTIIINGGTVLADGGENGSDGMRGDVIAINGGVVTATGGEKECTGGNTGGNTGINGKTVTISGGIVTATGGDKNSCSRGIGGDTVNISGGTVTATGGTVSGAGIGSYSAKVVSGKWTYPHNGGNVIITGGIVRAIGSANSAGIGGSSDSVESGTDGIGGTVVIANDALDGVEAIGVVPIGGGGKANGYKMNGTPIVVNGGSAAGKYNQAYPRVNHISISGTDVSIDTSDIVITFDRPLKALTGTIAINDVNLTGNRFYNSTNYTLTLPLGKDIILDNDSPYIISIRNVEDANGNPMLNEVTQEFATEPPTEVKWTNLQANGVSGTINTTELTLNFDIDPVTLSLSDITVTGARKGNLTGTGLTRKLTISDIRVAEGENITVDIINPRGFAFTQKNRTVTVHKAPPKIIEWIGLTANGTANTTNTTVLTFTFNENPTTLHADHITVDGATKGSVLSGQGNTRSLTISNIEALQGQEIVVTINNPSEYTITPNPKKVAINRQRIPVTWEKVTANGESFTTDTTELELTFSEDPFTLSANDITVTGATKGTLTGTGKTRTLNISNITVGEGQTITVTIANPNSYAISGNSKTVAIHRTIIETEWTGLTANGAENVSNTNTLTFTFSEDPITLKEENITVIGATIGKLSGTGKTRTLTISDLSLEQDEEIEVRIENPKGYIISGSPRTTKIHRGPKTITWMELTANGKVYEADTTELILTFSEDPITLKKENITVTGAQIGELTGEGTTRKLTISNISVAEGKTITVSITNPTGYTISSRSRTVVIHRALIDVELKGITANGTAYTTNTTSLTLTFDSFPVGLTADHIVVIGATRGSLTGSGNTRTLAISNITVKEGEHISVHISDPAGYTIKGSKKTVAIHRAPTSITWSLAANGVAHTTETTELLLSFSEDPTSLTINHITVTGATKGTLTGTGTTRTLTISDISVAQGKNVTVAISHPLGFTISGSSKTVAIHRGPTPITWVLLTANGTANTTNTTALTLTFSESITLSANDITVTGATKGTLTGSGATRTLNISNITVAQGELVTVSISNPVGFTILGGPKQVAINRSMTMVSWTRIAANGVANLMDTSELTLTFNRDPVGLSIDDVTITGAKKVSMAGSGTTRVVSISDITVEQGKHITVSLANPIAYTITDNPKIVAVHRGPPKVITWNELTANGVVNIADTTELTLKFSQDPTTLRIDDITVTGASKVKLTGSGDTRTLSIADILVEEGRAISVSIKNPNGFVITNNPKTVVVHRKLGDIPVKGVTLNHSAATLKVDHLLPLVATTNPIDASNQNVIWISSNPSVAKVENGIVTAIKTGMSVISATVEGKSAYCTITVNSPLISIQLNKTSMSLKKGQLETLSVRFTPADTTDNRTVVWSTLDSSIATVSNGIVTARKAGTTAIVANVRGITAMCKITVTDVPPPTIAKPVKPAPKVQLSKPTNLKFTAKKATWKNVRNNNGYTLKIRQGTKVIHTAKIKKGKTSYNIPKNKLKKGKNYNITLVAIGKGNYTNSKLAKSKNIKIK